MSTHPEDENIIEDRINPSTVTTNSNQESMISSPTSKLDMSVNKGYIFLFTAIWGFLGILIGYGMAY